MRQASGVSEKPPFRPEAYIGCGFTGVCCECGERVEHWHEVLLGHDGDPLIHATCAEGEDPEEFCPRCTAGVESDQHHGQCVVTGRAIDGEPAQEVGRDE